MRETINAILLSPLFSSKFSSLVAGLLLSHAPVFSARPNRNTAGSRQHEGNSSLPTLSPRIRPRSLSPLVFPLPDRDRITSPIAVIYRRITYLREREIVSLLGSRAAAGAAARGNITRDKVGRSREQIIYGFILRRAQHRTPIN